MAIELSYEFKNRMHQAPSGRNDGSGIVVHVISKIYREEGSEDAFQFVPGHTYKSFNIPWETMETVLASGGAGAISSAYKAALIQNLNTIPEPLVAWLDGPATDFLNQNANAADQAAQATAWIESLGTFDGWPLDFS